MTFALATGTIAGTMCLALTIVGVIQVRTGRVLMPAAGRVTDARAHGWMLLAGAAYCAAQLVVGLLDAPFWLWSLITVLGLGAIIVGSVAAFRRPPEASPTRAEPTGDLGVDPAEVFRRRSG